MQGRRRDGDASDPLAEGPLASELLRGGDSLVATAGGADAPGSVVGNAVVVRSVLAAGGRIGWCRGAARSPERRSHLQESRSQYSGQGFSPGSSTDTEVWYRSEGVWGRHAE
ncbi:hypothetical protein GCM10012275_09060 [Longimycelium tulufanense]|uniref:Uncharacterized protein n=1 Tax=Longimycelium tulufanense TaxID=907463 RepID=A0A8J3CAT2_9PSEU|nr:hypothetical protein GCM10012275_09060 [Longimycelium tulufanense]